MRKYLILTSLIFIISCGWNDTQWKVVQKIDLKFKILKDSNDERAGFRLVYMESDDSGYSPLVDNCMIVYYNSNYIYVKSLNLTKVFVFTKIKRENSFNLSSESRSIETISEKMFKKQILDCDECLKIDLLESR